MDEQVTEEVPNGFTFSDRVSKWLSVKFERNGSSES